jgi:hypothetical protein
MQTALFKQPEKFLERIRQDFFTGAVRVSRQRDDVSVMRPGRVDAGRSGQLGMTYAIQGTRAYGK